MAKQLFDFGTHQVYTDGRHGYCPRHDKVLHDGETCLGCETDPLSVAVEPTAEDLDAVAAEQAVEAQTKG